jgi:hypothetical protein
MSLLKDLRNGLKGKLSFKEECFRELNTLLMNNTGKKRLAFFKAFAQNLEWVKAHPAVSFAPDFENGYICPLCFELFFEKDLNVKLPNYLTLEDIPPKSLGGRPMALTCKKCNSRSGHELDGHLLKKLLENDAQLLLPNSKSKTVFSIDGNKLNGSIATDEKGVLGINLEAKNSNPSQGENFMRDLFPPRTIYSPLFFPDRVFEDEYQTAKFNIQFRTYSNERRAEIALLRIAYLIAFSSFGYGFLINRGLYKIREQILNPDKNILPTAFWIKYDFPKENEGINIVALPKELQCYLVIFTLQTNSLARQFAIALPGPSDPDLKVYDFINNRLCVDDGVGPTKAILEFIKPLNYLSQERYAFLSHVAWKKYTAEDYEPRFKPEP